MITGQKIVEKMEVTVGGKTIESETAIKYLGLIIDDYPCNTRSTGEDDTKYWRIILGVVKSIILYACPV